MNVPWTLAKDLSGVMIAYTLYLTPTYSMSHAKRSKSAIKRQPIFDA
jgi:hypothetical protein